VRKSQSFTLTQQQNIPYLLFIFGCQPGSLKMLILFDLGDRKKCLQMKSPLIFGPEQHKNRSDFIMVYGGLSVPPLSGRLCRCARPER
jgi:hypothetical protein